MNTVIINVIEGAIIGSSLTYIVISILNELKKKRQKPPQSQHINNQQPIVGITIVPIEKIIEIYQNAEKSAVQNNDFEIAAIFRDTIQELKAHINEKK